MEHGSLNAGLYLYMSLAGFRHLASACAQHRSRTAAGWEDCANYSSMAAVEDRTGNGDGMHGEDLEL